LHQWDELDSDLVPEANLSMVRKIYLCTYFDFDYLPKGLALYYSIKRYHNNFELYILTFDNQTFNFLDNLNEKDIKLISIDEYNKCINTSINKFEDKKQYYFSATSNLCLYLLEHNPGIDILLYLDADVYLFNKLDSLYDEFGDASIGFTPHRVNPILRVLVKHYGKYNVGVNLFRNSETGLKCLREWKKDCDEWYPNKPGYPLKFFSDQIFLDSWVKKYEGAKIINNIGINLCYWNAANYKISKKNDIYFVDDKPLIIYHFSTLRKIDDDTWNSYSAFGLLSIKGILLEIYKNYIYHIESFGLNNRKSVIMNHKESIHKRLFHSIFKILYKENINIQ
jgi:hypothetical protein